MQKSLLADFAERYTAAWCSQNAASVAACFSIDGSLSVNGAWRPCARAECHHGISSIVHDSVPGPTSGIGPGGCEPRLRRIPLDLDRYQHRAARYRTRGSHQWLRNLADRNGWTHRFFAGSLRQHRLRSAVAGQRALTAREAYAPAALPPDSHPRFLPIATTDIPHLAFLR
jgi:hypothetical protein